MAYTALPDMRIPYDIDGTVVYTRAATRALGSTPDFNIGPGNAQTSQQKIDFNDEGYANVTGTSTFQSNGGGINECAYMWMFFPERREITGEVITQGNFGYTAPAWSNQVFQGSNDSTNGVDGTWEAASFPGGYCSMSSLFDTWRSSIKPVSFTGGKATLRIGVYAGSYWQGWVNLVHIYGEKYAGQTPDDIIYVNHDDTPGVEYTAAEDFGDQPLGTTVVRQFRLKNVSATKTANTINIQCNDSDFAISTDGSTWVATINLSSLAAGAQSPTYYIRSTTPNPGGALGPRFARIVATVASYT